MKYQFMPPLTDEEILALREDISQNGMLHPIIVDEKGRILDGHHRAAIAAELGFKPERHVMEGLTETEKRTLAFRLNTGRRHMDREQRRQVVIASLKADPQLSDRQHARRTGVSHPTVAGIRAELETKGDVESFSTRTDISGRQQPASRPDRPAARGEEADGQPDAPGLPGPGVREAPTGSEDRVRAADSSVEGSGDDSTDSAEPRDSSEGSDAAGAPADFPAAGAPDPTTAVEGPSGTSADGADHRPAAHAAPAPAPADLPTAGAGVNPSDLGWKTAFLADVSALHRLTQHDADAVALHADSECIEELGRAFAVLGEYRAKVLAALKASLPTGETQ